MSDAHPHKVQQAAEGAGNVGERAHGSAAAGFPVQQLGQSARCVSGRGRVQPGRLHQRMRRLCGRHAGAQRGRQVLAGTPATCAPDLATAECLIMRIFFIFVERIKTPKLYITLEPYIWLMESKHTSDSAGHGRDYQKNLTVLNQHLKHGYKMSGPSKERGHGVRDTVSASDEFNREQHEAAAPPCWLLVLGEGRAVRVIGRVQGFKQGSCGDGTAQQQVQAPSTAQQNCQ